jgi:hypothetical protein
MLESSFPKGVLGFPKIWENQIPKPLKNIACRCESASLALVLCSGRWAGGCVSPQPSSAARMPAFELKRTIVARSGPSTEQQRACVHFAEA